jgi:flagellin-like protein
MKGISPMIATILLVAFVVAVGGIISVWMTGLTRTTTAGSEARSSAVTKCAGANLQIISAKPSNNSTTITHYGSDVNIYPLVVTFSDGTVNTTFTPKTAVSGGSTSTLNAIYPSGVTSVKVSAACEYGTVNVSVEATCTKGEDCWAS